MLGKAAQDRNVQRVSGRMWQIDFFYWVYYSIVTEYHLIIIIDCRF